MWRIVGIFEAAFRNSECFIETESRTTRGSGMRSDQMTWRISQASLAKTVNLVRDLVGSRVSPFMVSETPESSPKLVKPIDNSALTSAEQLTLKKI
jgi:hypothetical protein